MPSMLYAQQAQPTPGVGTTPPTVNPPMQTSPGQNTVKWNVDPAVLNWWGAFVTKHGGIAGLPTPEQRSVKLPDGRDAPANATLNPYEFANPWYHYEFSDGTHIAVDPSGQIKPDSVKYGDPTKLSTHPTKGTSRWMVQSSGDGASVLVKEDVIDDVGTWSVDKATKPLPFIGGSNATQAPKFQPLGNKIVQVNPDGTTDTIYTDGDAERRDNDNNNRANSREDRLANAAELQARAAAQANSLEETRQRLDSEYRAGTLALEEAKHQWDMERTKVTDLQFAAQEALKTATEAANEQYRQDYLQTQKDTSTNSANADTFRSNVTQRSDDMRTRSDARNTDVAAQRGIFQDLTTAAGKTADLALGSLPFMAPLGTGDDLNAMFNAIAQGKDAPAYSAKAMQFPYNPLTLVQDTINSGRAQLPTQLANTLNNPAGSNVNIPPQLSAPPVVNTPLQTTRYVNAPPVPPAVQPNNAPAIPDYVPPEMDAPTDFVAPGGDGAPPAVTPADIPPEVWGQSQGQGQGQGGQNGWLTPEQLMQRMLMPQFGGQM